MLSYWIHQWHPKLARQNHSWIKLPSQKHPGMPSGSHWRYPRTPLGLSNQLWEAKAPFITFEANDMRWVKSSWAKPVLSSFPPGNKSTASCQSPCASLAEINVQKWIALVSIPRQRVLEISAVNMVGLKQSNYDLTNQNVGFNQSKKGTFA